MEIFMYKLIIIDDEEEIRNGLRFFVESSQKDYEIIGEFDDGNEAIEFLNENEVDLVITDIKMNNVSGIDIMKFIYETKLSAKVIIISGYKKFDYSMAAIEYRARFYITKPTQYDELMTVFETLTNEIAKEKEEKQKNEIIHKQFQYFKNEFLKSVFLRNINEDEFSQKLEIVGESGDIKNCRFVVIGMGIASYEDWRMQNLKVGTSHGGENIISHVCDFFRDYMIDACCVNLVRGKFKFVVYTSTYKTAAEFMDFVDTKIKELNAYLKLYADVEPKFHISAGYESIEDFYHNIPVDLLPFEYESFNEDEYKIAQIEKYIMDNLTKDISLQQAADHFHYNMNYFSGYFKQQMGENFSSYVINMKMNMAKNLLRNTNKKLSEISANIGYGELSYFLKVFKKNVGESPMEYRRRHENK